jgi:uncharacterized protein (DUF302 family)
MSEDVPAVEVVTKHSRTSVDTTVERFLNILSSKNVNVFAVIDQRDAAKKVDLDLRETVLVIFGDPRAGTPVMVASPLTALDLPLKVLVWSNDGRTTISYESPQSLAARHQLGADLASRLEGINVLTDALVASD